MGVSDETYFEFHAHPVLMEIEMDLASQLTLCVKQLAAITQLIVLAVHDKDDKRLDELLAQRALLRGELRAILVALTTSCN